MATVIKRIQTAIGRNRRLAFGFAAIFVLSALLAIRALHAEHAVRKAELEARAEAYMIDAPALLTSEQAEKTRRAAEEKLWEMEKGLLGADNPAIGAALLQESFKSYTSRKGISVSSERALPSSEKGGYKRIPVEFQFKASLEDLKGLMEDIKASPTVMGVRSIRVKSPERGSGRLDVSLVLEGAMK